MAVLKKDWQWLTIIKPPKIHTIPDILTPAEIEQLIGATRKLRYTSSCIKLRFFKKLKS